MAATHLGSSVAGANSVTITIGAGSLRCLLVSCNQEGSGLGQLVGTYGGQTLQHVVGIAVGDATDNRTDIYYLNDAGITAAVGTAITFTSPPTSFRVAAQAYQGAMQTTPTTVDSEALTGDSDPLANIQIAAVSGEAVYGAGGTGNTSGGAATWAGTNPLTHLNTSDASSSCISHASRIVSATETVNHSVTYVTAPNRVSGAACLIEAGGIQITDVDTDEDYDDAETGVVITGSVFEATQGTGKVEISDNAVYATGTKVAQTVTAWADTSITITGVLGTLTPGPLWIWVTNDSAERNVAFVVSVHRAKAFAMSLSANIAASGENTTGQLTAPTAGTFFGGRIQDDENPADAVNPGSGQYLEDEWCIEALPASVDGETYQFRVLVDGVVQGTITVTPQLTISSGVSGVGVGAMEMESVTDVSKAVSQVAEAAMEMAATGSGAKQIPGIVSDLFEMLSTASGAPAAAISGIGFGVFELFPTAHGSKTASLTGFDDVVLRGTAEKLLSSAAQVICRVTFPTPSTQPDGLQKFRMWLRRDAENSVFDGVPTVEVELYESGSKVGSSLTINQSITSDNGMLLEIQWDAADLATADGSLVECRIIGNPGGPIGRERTIDIGSVEWCVHHFVAPGLSGVGVGRIETESVLAGSKQTVLIAIDRLAMLETADVSKQIGYAGTDALETDASAISSKTMTMVAQDIIEMRGFVDSLKNAIGVGVAQIELAATLEGSSAIFIVGVASDRFEIVSTSQVESFRTLVANGALNVADLLDVSKQVGADALGVFTLDSSIVGAKSVVTIGFDAFAFFDNPVASKSILGVAIDLAEMLDALAGTSTVFVVGVGSGKVEMRATADVQKQVAADILGRIEIGDSLAAIKQALGVGIGDVGLDATLEGIKQALGVALDGTMIQAAGTGQKLTIQIAVDAISIRAVIGGIAGQPVSAVHTFCLGGRFDPDAGLVGRFDPDAELVGR